MFQDKFICIKITYLVPYDVRMNKCDTQMNIMFYILPVSLDSETSFLTCIGRETVKNK